MIFFSTQAKGCPVFSSLSKLEIEVENPKTPGHRKLPEKSRPNFPSAAPLHFSLQQWDHHQRGHLVSLRGLTVLKVAVCYDNVITRYLFDTPFQTIGLNEVLAAPCDTLVSLRENVERRTEREARALAMHVGMST